MYDLIVIGAGSGGVRAARIAASFGAKVAIVEERFFGGTCVNVGCVPKKMFSYGAAIPDIMKLAADYGYQIPAVDCDWARLKSNKDREIARLNGIYERLLENAGVTIYHGHGSVLSGQRVQVAEQILSARYILIATGGKPFIPDIPGKQHILISDDLFSLEKLPKRVAVVGGGYIACEFASILHGLGCETSLLYRGDLFLRGFDSEVRQCVADNMREKGVNLLFSTDVLGIEARGSERVMHLTNGTELVVDAVFYATGRIPNIDGLFAEIAPERLENGALIVSESYQTSLPDVYALGDVIDRVQLTPVALAEGMWLARFLFAPEQAGAVPDYSQVPTAVFCHPNIGSVGLNEDDAVAQYGRVRVYSSRFRPLKYSLGDIPFKCLVKLIVDDVTDRVVGLHVVADDAGEIVQGFAVAMRCGATKADFDRTMGIHPTTAEELVTLRSAELRT